MKKYLNKISVIYFLLITLFFYMQAPVFFSNLSKEGSTLVTKQYTVLNPTSLSKVISFPASRKVIAVFWATWCAPCKLEMARLKESVEQGKIPPDAILAINPFETSEVIKKFLNEKNYPFTFIEAPDVVERLNINSTPSTAFIEDGKVVSLHSGLSLTGIWKAESFL